MMQVVCAQCDESFEVGPRRPLATYARMHDEHRVPLCPRCSDRWETDRLDIRPGFGAIILMYRLTPEIAHQMIEAGEAREHTAATSTPGEGEQDA